MGVMIKASEIDGAFNNGLFMFILASWLSLFLLLLLVVVVVVVVVLMVMLLILALMISSSVRGVYEFWSQFSGYVHSMAAIEGVDK